MTPVDLRSDTVTRPTEAMREAMAKAPLGDDVFGDDPTVNLLQEMAAARLGKEAGLFVPSGTMGNLAAILAHCGRGDEVIMGARSHTFLYEGGGISTLGGVHSHQVMEQSDGSLALADIQAAIRIDDDHMPTTRLITLENTHNRCGGVFHTPEYVRKVSDFAHEKGLLVHLDGARVFNAAVAQKVDITALTLPVDSVTFCLSKGLCAPVGSVLCGSHAFIRKARRLRKHLGGGMRQAGVIAAAGIIALETMIERLADDHTRAQELAVGLKTIPGLTVDAPATNMVYFNLAESIHIQPEELERKLREHGVLVCIEVGRRFRLVSHYWIDDDAIERTIEVFRQILS